MTMRSPAVWCMTFLLSAAMLVGARASAQEEEGAAQPSSIEEALGAAPLGPVPGKAPGVLPDVWCGRIDDPETQKVCWAAYRANLAYYETGLTHRSRVIRWQHTSTIIIFFVVIALVAAGMYFAWMQFAKGLAAAASAPGEPPAHSIELSMGGIKVSSPVLGVIILTLSLAFFYLYLVHAYPIKEIF